MKIKIVLSSIPLLMLFAVAQAQEVDTSQKAAEKLRAMHFNQDFEGGYLEGRKLSAQFPDSEEVRAWFVLNMSRNNMADEAVETAEKMSISKPDSFWSWFALASALNRHDSRGKESLAASEKALSLAPDRMETIWVRAEVLRRQDKADEAVTFIEQNIGKLKDPSERAELIVTKALALYPFGPTRDEAKVTASFAAFEEARRIDPQNVNAWYLHGYYLTTNRRYAESYTLLKKAVALSPLGLSIHSAYWNAISGLKDKTAEEKRAEIEADINALLAARPDSLVLLSRISNQYNSLKLTDKVKEVEDRILRLGPDSSEAEWVLVNRYRRLREEMGEAPNKEQTAVYRKALRDFIARPHHHRETLKGDAYRSLFYSIKDDPATGGDEILEVVRGMALYEGINPHTTFAGGAIALAERTKHFREAEKIARDGIVEAKKKIDSQRRFYETEGDYEKAVNWMTSMMYDALGWVFFNEGNLIEAEKELTRSYDLNHESLTNLHHLGRLYEAKKDFEKAEEFYIRGSNVSTPGANPNAQALKDLYEKRHGSPAGYEGYLAKLKDTDRAKRKERVLSERKAEAEPALAFTLKSLAGKPVSLESLRGRVVVINFWGVWCGWCVKEMPDFQKLHAKYKDDPDVVILTINNDPNPSIVAPWMRKHKYDFAVLFDDGYVNKVAVQSFPTTWFIDREGRKAFVKVGWSEKLFEEFTWRIEALRGSQAN
ncbi:MAG: redoxin domain-containing protein [Blastocatellia bacterium]|nr:redoxin domain-containing protein [Blastocatellia bacterium]